MSSSRGESKRTSTLSRGMRVVDEETRKYQLQKRLAALEADNYQEETYNEEEEEEEDGPKRKKTKNSFTSKSGSALLKRKPKSLDRLLEEERFSKGTIDYDLVAAAPSAKPKRHFCSVCGYIGSYSCTRCGSRFCSTRCNSSHKETRCLKFSI